MLKPLTHVRATKSEKETHHTAHKKLTKYTSNTTHRITSSSTWRDTCSARTLSFPFAEPLFSPRSHIEHTQTDTHRRECVDGALSNEDDSFAAIHENTLHETQREHKTFRKRDTAQLKPKHHYSPNHNHVYHQSGGRKAEKHQ